LLDVDNVCWSYSKPKVACFFETQRSCVLCCCYKVQ